MTTTNKILCWAFAYTLAVLLDYFMSKPFDSTQNMLMAFIATWMADTKND